jgi:hypothetical protein
MTKKSLEFGICDLEFGVLSLQGGQGSQEAYDFQKS